MKGLKRSAHSLSSVDRCLHRFAKAVIFDLRFFLSAAELLLWKLRVVDLNSIQPRMLAAEWAGKCNWLSAHRVAGAVAGAVADSVADSVAEVLLNRGRGYDWDW